jgi:hypothetical protein
VTRARMPGRRRAVVPVVIRCHRTSLARRAAWFLADLWAFLKSPRFLR